LHSSLKKRNSRGSACWATSIRLSVILIIATLAFGYSCSNSNKSSTPEILVAGGADSTGTPLATAELFNTLTGSWGCVGGISSTSSPACNQSMSDSRYGHTGTALADGRVLIAGGVDASGNALATAELYVPSSSSFICIGGVSSSPPVCNNSMNDARMFHTATLLSNGMVLLCGGLDVNKAGAEVPTAELFDPSSQSFTTVSSTMSSARALHAASLLPDGNVLVSGGLNGNQTAQATADVYATGVGTFVPAKPMNTARYSHTSTTLPNGLVLIAGGFDVNNNPLSSAELYDPNANSFTALPNSMTSPRAGHTATLLPDGKVLIAGGQSTSGTTLQGTNTAEIYDPVAQTFTATGSMNTARVYHIAKLLPNGTVLVAGGVDNNGQVTNSAEIYNPTTGIFTLTSSMVTARFAPSGNQVQQP